MQDGRQITAATQTTANLQVYADRERIQLGTIQEWKYPGPKSTE
jgi:hypothetical protein